jgi:hypothetical protein
MKKERKRKFKQKEKPSLKREYERREEQGMRKFSE